jgi:hypothetical protein
VATSSIPKNRRSVTDSGRRSNINTSIDFRTQVLVGLSFSGTLEFHSLLLNPRWTTYHPPLCDFEKSFHLSILGSFFKENKSTYRVKWGKIRE